MCRSEDEALPAVLSRLARRDERPQRHAMDDEVYLIAIAAMLIVVLLVLIATGTGMGWF